MLLNEIREKILLHFNVYNACNAEVPPFRITCEEHKALFDFYMPSVLKEDREKARTIKCFLGVELEIVTKVEDYC